VLEVHFKKTSKKNIARLLVAVLADVMILVN
jgi:hypothetical protein